jgi:hypothetical protein
MNYKLEDVEKIPPKQADPQPTAYYQKGYRPVLGRSVQTHERSGVFCIVDFQTQLTIHGEHIAKVVIIQGPSSTMVRVHYKDGTVQLI